MNRLAVSILNIVCNIACFVIQIRFENNIMYMFVFSYAPQVAIECIFTLRSMIVWVVGIAMPESTERSSMCAYDLKTIGVGFYVTTATTNFDP